MGLDDIITRWANQTVVIEHMTSSWDSEGNQVRSTGTNHTAIVQKTLRKVRGRDGTEKVANCEIILHSTYAVGYDDKITLPSGEQPAVLSIESPVDFRGVTAYYRVFT
jgi:hypothetical protein